MVPKNFVQNVKAYIGPGRLLYVALGYYTNLQYINKDETMT